LNEPNTRNAPEIIGFALIRPIMLQPPPQTALTGPGQPSPGGILTDRGGDGGYPCPHPKDKKGFSCPEKNPETEKGGSMPTELIP